MRNRLSAALLVTLFFSFVYVAYDSGVTKQKLKNLNKIVDSQNKLIGDCVQAIVYVKGMQDGVIKNQKAIATELNNNRKNKFL